MTLFRNVESEKLLFDVLSKFREHRDLKHKLIRETGTNVMRLKKGIESYGSTWLQDLAILMLYQGTDLSTSEIGALSLENVKKLSAHEWQISSPLNNDVLIIPEDNELFYLLEYMMIRRKSREESSFFFLGRNNQQLHDRDIIDLVERYSGQPGQRKVAPYFSLTAEDFAVIPTPLRINANPRYTGKNITIAFIDSGFYPHPDLTTPENRILSYVDITNPQAGWSELAESDIQSWHGMQTSVSACGNGHLSQGLYRGIASDAKVVLIKVSGKDHNVDWPIARGIEWAVEHKNQFNIRIINISMSSDSAHEGIIHPVTKAVQEATAAGIVVVAAAGNNPTQPILPPASAVSAITVGGVDDQNVLFQESMRMYHSSFGSSIEGLVKPEVIAPAIWIAAPVLPGSPTYYESLLLHRMVHALDKEIISIYTKNKVKFPKKPSAKVAKSPKELREWAEDRIKSEKLIATHYQHVDGTSFASPITASVIAQMLEVNPELTPKRIKKILINTARRLENVSSSIQGFGVISPFDAVEAAITNNVPTDAVRSTNPIIFKNRVTFEYKNPDALSVQLVGDFNQWKIGVTPMSKNDDGIWTVTREFYFPGRYRYKFLVNKTHWIDDPLNSRFENDGYNGKNSLFFIHTAGDAEEVFAKFLKTIKFLLPTDIKKRAEAFKTLDSVLQLPLSNRSYRVRQFFAQCIGHALDEISHEESEEILRIWQFYNMGYVIRASQLVFAFDLVTTRHVYNVFWDLEPTVVSTLADLIDILFVTHRHPDHLDLELAHALINRGKKVIIPSELRMLMPRGAISFNADDERTIAFPGKSDDWLKIKAFRGTHIYSKGRDIPLLYYKVTTSHNKTFLYLGDHDHTTEMTKMKGIDFAFLKCGDFNEKYSDADAIDQFLKKVSVQKMILGHINELGHPVKGGRISYREAFSLLEEFKDKGIILGWGEALTTDQSSDKIVPKMKRKKIRKESITPRIFHDPGVSQGD